MNSAGARQTFIRHNSRRLFSSSVSQSAHSATQPHILNGLYTLNPTVLCLGLGIAEYQHWPGGRSRDSLVGLWNKNERFCCCCMCGLAQMLLISAVGSMGARTSSFSAVRATASVSSPWISMPSTQQQREVSRLHQQSHSLGCDQQWFQ